MRNVQHLVTKVPGIRMPGLYCTLMTTFPLQVGYYSPRRIAMQKRLIVRLAAPLFTAMLTVLAAAPGFGQSKQAEDSPSMPKVGQMAPDFTLNYFDGNDLKPISLSQYRGKKNVVVAFFVFAFTGG
jgi:hypothetical protein